MEATIPARKRKKTVTRMTVYIDSKLVTRLWKLRGTTRKTLSDTVEEALIRLFEADKPA